MVKQTYHKPTRRRTLAHHAKHIFVPHKGNNYRPHLIRWRGLALVAVLSLIIQISYGLMTTGQWAVLGSTSNITTSQLVADTNREREKAGLGDLVENQQLSQAAFLKANDMFKHNYWAHTSPSGITPWYWFAQVGYNYQSAGENLAKNYPTADATVAAWMNSPTHRANVLDDKYVDVGFAVVDGVLSGRVTTLVVAEYGQPASPGLQIAPVFNVSSTNDNSNNPLTYFGSAIQSLSPASIGVMALLVLVAFVAMAAQAYRKKLPKPWRDSWKVHHGAYTLVGVMIVMLLLILATGGGQL